MKMLPSSKNPSDISDMVVEGAPFESCGLGEALRGGWRMRAEQSGVGNYGLCFVVHRRCGGGGVVLGGLLMEPSIGFFIRFLEYLLL